jgi:hypothetical protein
MLNLDDSAIYGLFPELRSMQTTEQAELIIASAITKEQKLALYNFVKKQILELQGAGFETVRQFLFARHFKDGRCSIIVKLDESLLAEVDDNENYLDELYKEIYLSSFNRALTGANDLKRVAYLFSVGPKDQDSADTFIKKATEELKSTSSIDQLKCIICILAQYECPKFQLKDNNAVIDKFSIINLDCSSYLEYRPMKIIYTTDSGLLGALIERTYHFIDKELETCESKNQAVAIISDLPEIRFSHEQLYERINNAEKKWPS